MDEDININEFYRQQVNRAGMMFIKLPGVGMIDDADYVIKVYPVNTWETRGEPLEIREHILSKMVLYFIHKNKSTKHYVW